MRRLALLAACGLALSAAPAQAKPLLGIHGDLPRFQELTLGASLPRWAARGGAGAPQPSVAFLVVGKAKPGIEAPGGANELDANFDPHTWVIGSAFWLRGSPLGKVTPLPPRATGFVFTTKGGASPAPLAPPAGATGIHVEWNPITGKLTKASWNRVGTLLAVIPLAAGQSALAVSG